MDKEFAWIREHDREYPGQWVAIYEDRLIAADLDLSVVLATVDRTPGAKGALLHRCPKGRAVPGRERWSGRQEAADVLLEHLPPSKVARSWSVCRLGEGDYLLLRRELFGTETVASLIEKVRAYERHDGPPDSSTSGGEPPHFGERG
jgi:hypothetical protein